MIEKISKKILDALVDENESSEQRDILLFGITRIVEDVPKYIAILIICALLGKLKEFCIVMLVTMIYKTFTGGVHLHTNIGCFIGSTISILSCIYIPQLLIYFRIFTPAIITFVYIFSIYVILTYVPADVPEIPIINIKRRKKDKIMSYIMLNVLFLITILLVKSLLYKYIIIITILNIDIMTTRTIYKLFKNKYGYENYVPDELLL